LTYIKERILQCAEKQGFQRSKFPEKIGMSASSFRGEALKMPIKSDSIDKVLSILSNIDLHWLITGYAEKEPIDVLNEDKENYSTTCKMCDEKEKRIKLLEKQIEELKQDKDAFKSLLGLKNDKTA